MYLEDVSADDIADVNILPRQYTFRNGLDVIFLNILVIQTPSQPQSRVSSPSRHH